jgi:thioredoxin 1
MIGPIIEDLAKKFDGKIKIGKLNVDENPDVAKKYEVLGIPSLKFFKNGEVIDEITGLQPKEVIIEKIESIIK